jgi:hypothetical protein
MYKFHFVRKKSEKNLHTCENFAIKSLLDCPLLISSQYGPSLANFKFKHFFVQLSYGSNVGFSSNKYSYLKSTT